MPRWFEDTLLALDLETTGLDPIEDRIVQAAVVLVGADGAVSDKSWDGIVDPGVPIPVGASNIHGITTERARQRSVQPWAVAAAGERGAPDRVRRDTRLDHDRHALRVDPAPEH